ncbi:hypothetical protein Tcan_14786 [Toxocara canis]|uniref:Uncharacterized protein n=1 Tax=Toxocara canis TaxID=6265 RepID=A0A0B2W5Y4_TOXCA|nr:hypothetical protein Tcan_14786 [Toxocara canis]
MEECKRTITVWMKNRRSHVEPLRSILWRVKNVSRIGETARGFPDGDGQLVELEWSNALRRFPPCILEICSAHAPLSSLVNAFRLLPAETLNSFFSHLKVLSLSNTDVLFDDVTFLVSAIPMLSAFSYSDSNLEEHDFDTLIKTLVPLQLRGMDMCDGNVDVVLNNLNLEMVRFCASPGIMAQDFVKSMAVAVTVKFVIAQELKFAADNDAELFLSVLCERFPRMDALFWDWNMVDPEIRFDERAKAVAETLVNLYRSLNLRMLAVVAYTPSSATYSAAETLIQYFIAQQLQSCTLKRLATKGLKSRDPNFVLILAGSDTDMMRRIDEVVCGAQNPTPDLRHLLYVLDARCATHETNATFEFLGFDEKLCALD